MKYKLNNIYNEDSYVAIKQILDKSVDCIIIDPPYEIDAGGFGKGGLADRKGKQKVEMISCGLYSGFDYAILNEFVRVLKKINIFIWCSKQQIKSLMDYFLNLPNKEINFDILTWHKTNPAPTANMTYLNDTEYCLNFREKGVIVGGTYEQKKKYWITPINKSDKDIFKHFTIKPLEIIKNLIEVSTQPNDIVADFFLGSGTTAVACAETGRQYLGFEINKKWFDIAYNRLNKIDGNGQMNLFLK